MAMMKQLLTEVQEEDNLSFEEAVDRTIGLECPFYDGCSCSYGTDWRFCPHVWDSYREEVTNLGMEIPS